MRLRFQRMPPPNCNSSFAAAFPPQSLVGIPDGIEGTRATLDLMRRLVRAYRTDPALRNLAEQIIRGVPEKQGAQEIDALRMWIRQNIRYTNDINAVEMLQAPPALLNSGNGDCDDQATLLATLAETIGYPARFAAVAFAPDQFAHVFAEVRLGTRWIPAETTEDVNLGWYPPGVVSRMTVHI